MAGSPHLRTPVTKVTTEPLPYTGTPWRLFASDIKLFLKNFSYLPFIFLPLSPCPSGQLDELFPSWANLVDVAFHSILFFTQLAFLISVFVFTFLPVWAYFGYIVVMFVANELVCSHFNRGIPHDGLKSTENEDTRLWERHDSEAWIFLNGICVG